MAPTGGGKQWKVNILLSKKIFEDQSEEVLAMTEMLRTGKHQNKGPMMMNHCLKAWLMIYPIPCLIYAPDLQDKVDLFVQNFKDQLKTAGYESVEEYLKGN